MLKISDKKFFCEILADALVQTHLNCASKDLRDSCINAFAQAAVIVLEGDTTFVRWNPHEKVLLVWMHETKEIRCYSNRDWSCTVQNINVSAICKYRAINWLVENYYELQLKPGEISQTDFAEDAFFDSQMTTEQKIDLLSSCVSEGRDELKPLVEALNKFIAPITSIQTRTII